MIFICIFSLAPGNGDAFTSFLLGCPRDLPVGTPSTRTATVAPWLLIKRFALCQAAPEGSTANENAQPIKTHL